MIKYHGAALNTLLLLHYVCGWGKGEGDGYYPFREVIYYLYVVGSCCNTIKKYFCERSMKCLMRYGVANIDVVKRVNY